MAGIDKKEEKGEQEQTAGNDGQHSHKSDRL
jgi:hypothetical protein